MRVKKGIHFENLDEFVVEKLDKTRGRLKKVVRGQVIYNRGI